MAHQFKVVVLTGARQTGKTTLLRNLFPEWPRVTLDLPQDAALAEGSPREFLARHSRPLVIDEVQYAPGVFRHVKSVVDESEAKGQFILTGSQRFVLMRNVAESLAGRAAVLELHGLSAEELGDTLFEQLGRERLSGVLARGSYPALWGDPDISTVDFFRSYTSTWLERDLRQALNVGSLREFDRFLRACAARSGQLLNRADLARDVGIAPSTAGQWLSTLEASGLIVLLEPWFSNVTKRIIKTPKLYFMDTGLLTFLLGLDAVSLQNYAGLGAIWETYLIGELIRWREAHHPESMLHFYRDKDGLEVDFVIHAKGKTYLVDAKLTELPRSHDTKSVLAAEARIAEKAVKALAVPVERSFPVDGNVRAISGFRLDELFESTD